MTDIVEEAIARLQEWKTFYSPHVEMRDAAIAVLRAQKAGAEYLRRQLNRRDNRIAAMQRKIDRMHRILGDKAERKAFEEEMRIAREKAATKFEITDAAFKEFMK